MKILFNRCKIDGEKLRENDCSVSFKADSKNFFPLYVVAITGNTINKNPDCLKKNLGVWRC